MSRRSSRWEEGCFVVEGAKVLSEALSTGARIQSVYLDSAAATTDERDLAARCESATGARIIDVEPGVLARVCDTETPQPVAAVVDMIHTQIGSTAGTSLVVVLAGLQDPGNAGAVLRVAGAAGAGAVVFCDGSVDVYNPKTVRSSAGALFHVPVVIGAPADSAEEVLDQLGRMGLRRWGTASKGGIDYREADLASPAALVFGNEAHGLSHGATSALDGVLTIPMAEGIESLNVATAAAVLCFECAGRRHRVTRAPGAGVA